MADTKADGATLWNCRARISKHIKNIFDSGELQDTVSKSVSENRKKVREFYSFVK